MNIRYEGTITVSDYNYLRSTAGWGMLPLKQAQAGIDRSDFLVVAKEEDKTIGMARVITDGGCVALILDVVVLPEYQGKGIGKTILQMILSYIENNLDTGEIAYVALMAAKGKEGFYQKLGFEERPNDHHGAGMTQWIKK
ncbi:MAG: GCN5-related N-acetyltransferase [Herbinix sp.]|jgi:GNAT superfamily N-acetyltransferase|nr:GCN5-related N-acetyltransferase [Herbinix sp.]